MDDVLEIYSMGVCAGLVLSAFPWVVGSVVKLVTDVLKKV